MDIMAEDRSRPISCPAPPPSHPPPAMRMPPPLGTSRHPAAAAATTAASDQRWVSSNPSQVPPNPRTHDYPIISNRGFPQVPPNGPYGRPSSLPEFATTPPNAHHHPPPLSGSYRVNGTGTGAPSHPSLHHNAPPLLVPLEYRSHLPIPPPEQSTNGESSAHSTAPVQYPTPAPAPIPQTPTPFDSSYRSQAHGMHQRRAARAQQVSHTHTERESRAGGQVTQLVTALGLRSVSGEKGQMR